MHEITIKRLKEAGWYKGRKIDTDQIVLSLRKIGIDLPDSVITFVQEYGLLKINPLDKEYFDVSFDPILAVGKNYDANFFVNCLSEYEITDMVYPIGVASQKNMLVLMTKDEKMFCFTNGCLIKVGNSIDECLDCLVGEVRDYERLD